MKGCQESDCDTAQGEKYVRVVQYGKVCSRSVRWAEGGAGITGICSELLVCNGDVQIDR